MTDVVTQRAASPGNDVVLTETDLYVTVGRLVTQNELLARRVQARDEVIAGLQKEVADLKASIPPDPSA